MSNSSDACNKIAEIELENKKVFVSETETDGKGLFAYADQNGKVLMVVNKSFGRIGAQGQSPDGCRLHPSYTSDYYDKILKSKTDVLGRNVLAQKDDPSYEKIVELLPCLQEPYTFLGDKEYHERPLPRIDWNGSIGGFLGFGLNGKPILFNRVMHSEYDCVKHSLLDGYLPAIQFVYLNEKEQIGWEEIAFARAYPEHENIMLVFIRLKVRNLSDRPRKEDISIFCWPYYKEEDLATGPYFYPTYNGSPDKTEQEWLWVSEESNHQKGEVYPFGIINRACQFQGGEEKSFYLTLAYPRCLKEGAFERLGPSVNFYGALFETKRDWDRFLGKGMQIETPEARVNNACKATLIQSFMTVVDSDVKYASAGCYATIPSNPWLDGLPISIINSAECFSEWGFSKEVGRYLAYYLKHYINPDGTVTYKHGTGAYDYGLLLYAICRHYHLSNKDADWVRQNILPVKNICNFIIQKRKESLKSNPAGSILHGLLPTSLGDDLNYMGGNCYNYAHDACCWLGLLEVGKMMMETGRGKSLKTMSASGKELVDFAEAYKRDIVASVKKAINPGGKPVFVPIYPNDNKPFPALTSSVLASYSNYLYYPSLLYSNLFNTDISSAVIKFREKRGGDMLGTSRFMTHMDDWPIVKLGWALINLDMVKKFLLTYYGDLAHHRMREIFTAYEQVSIKDEGSLGRRSGMRKIMYGNNICSTLTMPRMTKYMLVFEERDKDVLWLNRASPRRWLEDGKKIVVRNAPTRWGKISYCVESHAGTNHISAEIDFAAPSPKSLLIKLRLRHPRGRKLSGVIVDGGKWRDMDQEKETVDIPCRGKKKIIVEAYY